MQTPIVLWGGYRRESTRLYIGDSRANGFSNLFVLGAGVLDQAQDGFLDESRRARRSAFCDLPFNCRP